MPANAPVKEIGYTQAPNYNWWLYDNETTPELIWPQSVYVYDQMRRTDSQVGSVLRAVTETLLRTPWRIDPAGARARVVKFVADDLGLPIVGKKPTPPPRLKDRFSWASHLREALLMLPYGHSYFEQVYRVSPDGNAAHLRKLAYRPAKTIERIDVAPDGGLIAIKQYWTQVDTEPKPIPVDRLVAYIHAKEGGNWLGTSILRNCYKNWLLKDRLLRVQAQTIERNGMGIPLYTAAETEESLAAGLGMATSWRAGEAAGSAIPFGASLKLVGVEGTLPDAQPVIDYHDSQIARAVLAHFLNLGQQTGSWALGTTFADFFTMSLQTLAEQIRDTATQHIVEDLVDINFGENEPAPRLVFDEIGSRQAATAAALKTLVDAGILHPDQVLEESSRQQYGLPPADPATATPPPGAAPTPAEPTAMGDLSVAAKYNPAQPRDPGGDDGGRWVRSPGAGGSPAKDAVKLDALKLAGKIDLEPGEQLVGSGKVDGDAGGIRMALTERGGERRLRFGAGPEGYGQRNREEGTAAWSGNPPAKPLTKTERDRLNAQIEALDEEWDDASPARQDEIDSRRADVREQLVADDQGFNGTAELDEYSMRRLIDRIRPAMAEAVEQQKAQNDAWDELDALESRGGGDPERIAELRERARVGNDDYLTFTEGILPGSAWGDVHYSVELDDPTAGAYLRIGVQPKGAPDDWAEGRDWQGTFDAAETKRFLRLLDNLSKSGGVQAASGDDMQLKRYWLHGDGAAKWSTWTDLYGHLKKHMADEMAKRAAAEWFHERYGYWPGDHRNLQASADAADSEAEDWEEAIAALVQALAELSGEVSAAAFDPAKHPRGAGGKFRSTVDKLKDAIKTHRSAGAKGDPFPDFDREQLRRAAVKRPGITLSRGESRESIAQKLLDDLAKDDPSPVVETPRKAAPKRAPRKKAEPRQPTEPKPEPAPEPEPEPAPKPVPVPVEPQVAARYAGPMFAYSSPAKEKAAQDAIALQVDSINGTLSADGYGRLSDIEEQAGFTDAELGHIRQEALIAANVELWRSSGAPHIPDAAFKADMGRRSKEAWSGKPIAVRVTHQALAGVLKDGRFKSQFETNKSKGLLDKKVRARSEEKWFGLTADSDPAKRPIYGYVAVEGPRNVKEHPEQYLNQYGTVQVVLKDSVRARTTAMWGDSLNQADYGIPEPVDSPTWRSYTLALTGVGNGELVNLDRDTTSEKWREWSFVEAQIHDGVSTDDIAEVILDKNPTAAVKSALGKAGIPWRVA
jgi:hypothetical protein